MPERVRYRFILEGALPDNALDAFPELTASQDRGGEVTKLDGPVDDHSLRSIIARIDTLGLRLLEMRELPG